MAGLHAKDLRSNVRDETKSGGEYALREVSSTRLSGLDFLGFINASLRLLVDDELNRRFVKIGHEHTQIVSSIAVKITHTRYPYLG